MAVENIISEIIDKHKGLEGPLLPILHALQERLGFIPEEAPLQIGKALNLSTAEVIGVVSFYHDFRSSPSDKTRVQICCAEACQARGSRELKKHADVTHSSQEKGITIDKVYCLGNCACGPSVRIGDAVHGRVTPERFDQLVRPFSEGGSQ